MPAARRCSRDEGSGLARAGHERIDQVHRHLGRVARPAGPGLGSPGLGRRPRPAGPREVGRRHPHVEGHQDRPGTDGGGAGGRVRRGGAEVRRQVAEGPAADVGQRCAPGRRGSRARRARRPASRRTRPARRWRRPSSCRRGARTARRRRRPGGGGRPRGSGGRGARSPAASALGAASPTRVNTARWWSGSACRSSRSRPAASASSRRRPTSRPSLMLTTHSSTRRAWHLDRVMSPAEDWLVR